MEKLKLLIIMIGLKDMNFLFFKRCWKIYKCKLYVKQRYN